MLHYDPVRTYAEHDHRSAAELLDSLGFSDRGRAMLFEVFAHSFFNVEQRYSAAEFLAMCHFYFTANPEGLGMDAPTEDYRTSLWEPFTRLLEKHGATVSTGTRAVALRPDGARGWAVDVEGEPARHARHLVVTTDVPATRDLVAASPELVAAAPGLARRIAALPSGEPYVVARLFCEGDVDPARARVHRRHPRAGPRLGDAVPPARGRVGALGPGARGLGDRAALVRLPVRDLDRRPRRGDAHRARRALARGRRPAGARRRGAPLHQRARASTPATTSCGPASSPTPAGCAWPATGWPCDVPSALMERAAVTAVTAANDVLREEGVGPEPMRSIRPRGRPRRSPSCVIFSAIAVKITHVGVHGRSGATRYRLRARRGAGATTWEGTECRTDGRPAHRGPGGRTARRGHQPERLRVPAPSRPRVADEPAGVLHRGLPAARPRAAARRHHPRPGGRRPPRRRSRARPRARCPPRAPRTSGSEPEPTGAPAPPPGS